MLDLKNSISDYTEKEFTELLEMFMNSKPSEEGDAVFFDWLKKKVSHPKRCDLLTHPTMCGIEDSPKAMTAEIKRWYEEQGLPCFKE